MLQKKETTRETEAKAGIALTGGRRKGIKALLQGETGREKSTVRATERAIEILKYRIQQRIQKRRAVQKEKEWRKIPPEELKTE